MPNRLPNASFSSISFFKMCLYAQVGSLLYRGAVSAAQQEAVSAKRSFLRGNGHKSQLIEKSEVSSLGILYLKTHFLCIAPLGFTEDGEMALVGYARVSTVDQTAALQIDALNAAGCERIFNDTASGAQHSRPELNEALRYLRKGDTLVVWKLDRLARSLAQLLDTIDDLAQRGIGFRSLTEAIDTTTAGGRLIFHIFGSLAEFERAMIRERTVAGLAAARARGRKGGRPRALGEERLAAAAALIKDGSLTIRQVAQQLGVSEATLYKHIPSPRSRLTAG